jgi:hypothetical protein
MDIGRRELTLSKAGRGFVELFETGLESASEQSSRHYCISMFHQLHCIVSPLSGAR